MTLTPEDVINKRFQPTKFREGYDQDEVDDFLDEIVVELRRLNQENEELRRQVETAGGQVAPAQRSESPVAAAAIPQETQVINEPVAAPAPVADQARTVSGPPSDSVESAAGVLAMAQKIHDEYVSQGRNERERLITEGRSQADKLISDGKRTREEILTTLERERAQLEGSVSQLRSFEQAYRNNLREYITGQLREVESTGSLSPANAPASASGSRAVVK